MMGFSFNPPSSSMFSSSTSMTSAYNAASQSSNSMSTGLESFTKKVSGAISAIPLKPSLSDNESKRRLEEDKKANSQLILSLLEGIRLQTPQTHAGLVVAFTAATLSPLGNSGLKFHWYKMVDKTKDSFTAVDESSRAWYAPTSDDIGCKICVQCEDIYDQGMSRYLEVSFEDISW